MEQTFVNGFESWAETHHEIAGAIQILRTKDEKEQPDVIKETQILYGTAGFYSLAIELTDEFERLHSGREWDGEFFDEIDNFIKDKFAD